jgi:hypothetical protein
VSGEHHRGRAKAEREQHGEQASGTDGHHHLLVGSVGMSSPTAPRPPVGFLAAAGPALPKGA